MSRDLAYKLKQKLLNSNYTKAEANKIVELCSQCIFEAMID